MKNVEIHQFICRKDNFGILVHDKKTGRCASIDAPDEARIMTALSERGWVLDYILITHWHKDHVAGIAGLKKKFNCRVIGPALRSSKIKGLDHTVEDGDEVELVDGVVRIISTPGHTLDMINFHFIDAGVVFVGDTLFSLGCGRIFEGDGPMMWKSLQKLTALPRETIIYCGHEYTLANGQFAMSMDPENKKLESRMENVIALRKRNLPALPTTIGKELDTNPFLRVHDPAIRANLDMKNASDAEVFTELRKRKDKFRESMIQRFVRVMAWKMMATPKYLQNPKNKKTDFDT